MNVCFLITTCNRKEGCQSLVNALQGLGDIFVLNDGSNYEIKNCNYFSNIKRLGKEFYWHTVNCLWTLPEKKYDYYFMIPDDFYPVKNFVEKSIKIWESIKDEKKICMNLFRDKIPRAKCWTNTLPVEYDTYRKIQWVDMCFMCEEQFFKAVGEIPKVNFNWRANPHRSTGVGSYISIKLHRAHYSLYQTRDTMFYTTIYHEESQLDNNPFSKSARKGGNA